MATTAVTLFNSGEGLPAHLADMNEETNIVTRERIPTLSYRGKQWRIVMDGQEKIVERADGEPATIVAGVILDYNKARSRAYFDGPYEEGKVSMPRCWSPDGKKPDAKVSEPIGVTCDTCEMSKKGSKVIDGREMTACSQFKRMVFVPIQNTKHPKLLLKIAATSIWDKDAEEFAAKGYYAFDQYLDMLKRRGINHTATVVTKIKFDPRPSYPKLFFGPADWLPAEQVPDIREQLADKDGIAKILNVDPSGEVDVVDKDAPATPAAAPAAPPAAAAPAAAPKAATKPAAAASKPKAATAPPPPPAKPAVDPEDEEEQLAGFGSSKPAAAAKPAPAAAAAKAAAKPAAPVQVVEAGAADGVGDLLSSWEDE